MLTYKLDSKDKELFGLPLNFTFVNEMNFFNNPDIRSKTAFIIGKEVLVKLSWI